MGSFMKRINKIMFCIFICLLICMGSTSCINNDGTGNGSASTILPYAFLDFQNKPGATRCKIRSLPNSKSDPYRTPNPELTEHLIRFLPNAFYANLDLVFD